MGLNGTSVLLLVNTGTEETPVLTAVGSQRNLSREETTEEIDVSSKTARAKRALPGRYGSSMSLDALCVPSNACYRALKAAMRDGELIVVRVSEDGVEFEEADALVTSIGEEWPDQEEATISVDLTIDGEWTAVPAAPEEPEELISNGGFESGLDDWVSAGDGFEPTVLGTSVHGGAAALLLLAGMGRSNVSQDAPVTAGRTYRLSVWTRGSDTVWSGSYGVVDETHSADIIETTPTLVTSSTWTEVTDEFVAPSGCEMVSVWLFGANVMDIGHDVYFDDVSLIEVI